MKFVEQNDAPKIFEKNNTVSSSLLIYNNVKNKKNFFKND